MVALRLHALGAPDAHRRRIWLIACAVSKLGKRLLGVALIIASRRSGFMPLSAYR